MNIMDAIVKDVEADFGVTFTDYPEVSNVCGSAECDDCTGEIRAAAEKQAREMVEAERQQILRDIDSYNRTWYENNKAVTA